MTASASQGAKPRAAIYARISRDKTKYKDAKGREVEVNWESEGQGNGTQRQIEDCRKLAARLGWQVVDVFEDNDISAYQRRKPRPHYQEMLEAVREGSIDAIIAWHPDRLHRRVTELDQFIEVIEDHRVQIETVNGGSYDLTTASGRMVARILGSVAQHEVEHAKERMQAKRAQMAAEGAYRGGRRPFGYEKDGVTPRASEAAVVLEATRAILRGRTLRSLAAELNERGVTGTSGGPINALALRDILMRPRNAGLLSEGQPGHTATDRLGTASGDTSRISGKPVQARKPFKIVGAASWPAIVPEDEWRAMFELLNAPSRLNHTTNVASWLGSGIYRCGALMVDPAHADEDDPAHLRECGLPLRMTVTGSTPSRPTLKRTYHYRCNGPKNHMTITASYMDDYVIEVLAEMVRDPALRKALELGGDDAGKKEREALSSKRSALEARRQRFDADYMAERIDASLHSRAVASVDEELASVQAEIDRMTAKREGALLHIVKQSDPGQALLDSPLDVQRAILSSLLTVTVISTARAGMRPGQNWSENRLRIERAERF